MNNNNQDIIIYNNILFEVSLMFAFLVARYVNEINISRLRQVDVTPLAVLLRKTMPRRHC